MIFTTLLTAMLAIGAADASVYHNKANANSFQAQAVGFSGKFYIQNVKSGALVAFNTRGRTPNLALTRKRGAPITLSSVRGKWTRIKVNPSVNKCWSSQWDHRHGINWAATLYACCSGAANCDNGGNQGALRYQKQSFLFVPATASSIARASRALHRRDFQSGDEETPYDSDAYGNSAYDELDSENLDTAQADSEPFADDFESVDSPIDAAEEETFAEDESFESESDAQGASEANELDVQEGEDFLDYVKRSEADVEAEDLDLELQDNLAFPDNDIFSTNSTTDDAAVTSEPAPQLPSDNTSSNVSIAVNSSTSGVLEASIGSNGVEIAAVNLEDRSRHRKSKKGRSHKKSSKAYYIISVDHVFDMKTRVVSGKIMTSAGRYKSLALATLDAHDKSQQWRVIRA